jgi:carbon monoxide dehydrogenase subunit G
MVNQRWLNQKLKKLKARKRLRKMENTKDVEIHVTGVSMSGKAEINYEHSRTPQEDQTKVEGAEIGNSREDD